MVYKLTVNITLPLEELNYPPSAMAHLDTLSMSKPLRLDPPTSESDDTHFFVDHGHESLQDAPLEEEEEVNSLIAVSISRTQTILVSPRTPAHEKVAALDGSGTFHEGFFQETEDGSSREDSGISTPEEDTALTGKVRPAESSTAVGGRVSPWTATPKLFETPKSRNKDPLIVRPRASTESTGILPDINIKRLWSGFQTLSLPKSSSLRDLPVPSLSSIFSKENFNGQRTDHRPKTANSSSSPSPNYAAMTDGDMARRNKSSSPGYPEPADVPQITECILPNPDSLSRIAEERRGSIIHGTSRAPSLRRVKSDQSLMLRHTTSHGSTFGDDSRWENVQDQVNSRFKAIVDSLQDSNIKLPSLPNINFSGFRPDFTWNRTWSESKKPNSDGESSTTGGSTRQNNLGDANLRLQNNAFSNGSNVALRSPKPVPSLLEQALDQLTGDVVIMGGYRGSVLRSAKPPHRQLWVPVKVGLNIRKVNLQVGLSPEDEENMEDIIIPSGMLSHIGPVDMGRRLLKRLHGCANSQQKKIRVHDYGYDWRLSPQLLSQKLIAFLERLPCNAEPLPKGERGATIIAHSLGGLITRHAINQRPELFAGVVYAGTPQHCINILGPLRKGDDVLLSSRVLTAQVNFTLRTSFLLLPEDGKCFIDKQTKEDYPVNFFDVEDWKEHAFSPCIAPTHAPAAQPERKGILGTVSESLSSLPLPVKRGSFSSRSAKDPPLEPSSRATTRTAATKLDEVTKPASTIIDPQLNSSSSFLPTPSSISTTSTIPLPLALSYLTRTLAQTLAFKHQLSFSPTHASSNVYPPLSILYSTSVPTVLAARVSSREAIKCADAYDDLAFASGDWVCLAKAAMVPAGYKLVKGGMVRTERGHVGLLGDLEAVGKCLLAVGEARRKGVGLGLG